MITCILVIVFLIQNLRMKSQMHFALFKTGLDGKVQWLPAKVNGTDCFKTTAVREHHRRTHKCETLDRTIQELAQVDMEALENIFIRTTMSIFSEKETYFQLKSLEITVFPLAGSALGPLESFQRRRTDCCTKQSKLAKIESMEEGAGRCGL